MGLSTAYHNHIENSISRECKKQYVNAQTDALIEHELASIHGVNPEKIGMSRERLLKDIRDIELFRNIDMPMAEAFNESMQSEKPRLKDLFKQLSDSDKDLLVLFTRPELIHYCRPSVDAEIRAHSVYVGEPKTTEKSILYKNTGVKGENAIALGSKEDK